MRFITLIILALSTRTVSSDCPPVLGGCQIFPPGDEWNRRIDNDPVDYMSSCWTQQMATSRLHLDMGTDVEDDGVITKEIDFGIPFNIVDEKQAKVPITYYVEGDPSNVGDEEDWSDESDSVVGGLPIPLDARVEQGKSIPGRKETDATRGDRHLLTLDNSTCQLWEMNPVTRLTNGWKTSQVARFDLWKKNDNRLSRFPGEKSVTSGDAAGLPILPGLLRYDEAASGVISHALRFTMRTAPVAYRFPGTHFGTTNDSSLAPYATRFRLRKDFPETAFQSNAVALTIIKALKKYGVIFADQGSNLFIQGSYDERWGSAISVVNRAVIYGSDFEAVQSPYPVVWDTRLGPYNPTCNGKTSNINPTFTPTPDPDQANCPIIKPRMGPGASGTTGTTTTATPTTKTPTTQTPTNTITTKPTAAATTKPPTTQTPTNTATTTPPTTTTKPPTTTTTKPPTTGATTTSTPTKPTTVTPTSTITTTPTSTTTKTPTSTPTTSTTTQPTNVVGTTSPPSTTSSPTSSVTDKPTDSVTTAPTRVIPTSIPQCLDKNNTNILCAPNNSSHIIPSITFMFVLVWILMYNVM